ncbi:unnamed protein product [Dovyalis caffra]|uniref:Uncharacterized protein n=1 Tax=Dovyalis caffra TaxID=77055 RepID=A0AAV1SER8_9ROSI|nr:unnamed protein product [Dovyalis caffra]
MCAPREARTLKEAQEACTPKETQEAHALETCAPREDRSEAGSPYVSKVGASSGRSRRKGGELPEMCAPREA